MKKFSGVLLRRMRNQCGFTLEQVGSKMGCSGTLVGLWEHETRKPSPTQIQKLEGILNCPDSLYVNTPEPWDVLARCESDVLRAVMVLSNADGLKVSFDKDKTFRVDFEATSPGLRSAIGQYGYMCDALHSDNEGLVDWDEIIEPWAQKKLDELSNIPLNDSETQSNKTDNEQIERDTRSE